MDTSNWSAEDWDNYMEGVAVSQGNATKATAAQYVGAAAGSPYGGGDINLGGVASDLARPVHRSVQAKAAGYTFNIPEVVPDFGGEYNLKNIIPGGAPFHIGKDIPGGFKKTWYTGTTSFGLGNDGKYYVYLAKKEIWKHYKPGGALVIGKAFTPKNARKVIRAKKHWAKLGKLLNKINPKRSTRREKSSCRQ